jgi:flavin reductase (DIM6/NTAB) family NADH-FMN oxidoreductase RutF
MKQFLNQDILDLPKRYRTNLINCLSGFKSLCLVGTADAAGQTNLSLVSSVIHVGANPPLMGMLMRPHTVPRHTIENIEATGYFTLNHVSEAIYEAAHQASARYPKEVSEFEDNELTAVLGDVHPAPYVGESPLRIGLALRERYQVQANKTELIIGEIVELWVPEEAVGEDGFVDLETTGSLTVSGLDSYHRTERIGRLAYAKYKG